LAWYRLQDAVSISPRRAGVVGSQDELRLAALIPAEDLP
jgi:hypothetical protein